MTGSLRKNVAGSGRVCLSCFQNECFCSCCEVYRWSPVMRRSSFAFHDRIKGKYVSGRKNKATIKAAPDIIRVIHSVQRQPRFGLETIQPPAIGAITGAMTMLTIRFRSQKRLAYMLHLPKQQSETLMLSWLAWTGHSHSPHWWLTLR